MHLMHKRGGLALLSTILIMLIAIPLTIEARLYLSKSRLLGRECQRASQGELVEKNVFTGLATPVKSVNLTSERTGRVSKILVQEGDRVVKGQIVALMDWESGEKTMHIKKQEIHSLINQYNKLRVIEQMSRSLVEQGAVSRSDLVDKEALSLGIVAQIRRTEGELDEIYKAKNDATIRSPLDGTVSQIFSHPGTFVSPMTSTSDSDQSTKSTIMQIYSGMQVVVNAPESDALALINSRDISIYPSTDPTVSIPAIVDKPMPYVVTNDKGISFIPVRLRILDAAPFLPGMSVDVVAHVGLLRGVLIKQIGIVQQGGVSGIYLCRPSGLIWAKVNILGSSQGVAVVDSSPHIHDGISYSLTMPDANQAPDLKGFVRFNL